jgi:hypothetical protein
VCRCDDGLAEVDDPCSPKPGDANYACALDGTMKVVCDSETRRFRTFTACRGPLRCRSEDHHTSCDQELAREGDPCYPVDNVSCSEDASLELRCSAERRWIQKRACSRNPCLVYHHSEIYRDEPLPPRAPRAPIGGTRKK